MDQMATERRPFEWRADLHPSVFDRDLSTSDSLFKIPDFDLPGLQIAGNDGLELDEDSLPLFDTTLAPKAPTLTSPNEHIPEVANFEPLKRDDPDLALWDLDLDVRGDERRFRTWEAFEGSESDDNETPIYLSEAGAASFDAALAVGPHSHLTPGVLPQDACLRAACSLALGRSSILFQWNAKTTSFELTLPDVPTSGLSLDCCNSFTDSLTDLGSALRTLSDYAHGGKGIRGLLPAVTALKRCVSTVLDALEISMTQKLQSVRSLQQLQLSLYEPIELTKVLRCLVTTANKAESEEEAISMLSDEIRVLADAGSPFTQLLQQVLRRVCRPWLSSLMQDIGLDLDSAGGNSLDSDERRSTKIEQARPASAPSFIDTEHYGLVMETTISFALLKQHRQAALSDAEPRWTKCHPQAGQSGSHVPESPPQAFDSTETGDSDQEDLIRSLNARISDAPLLQTSEPNPLHTAVIDALADTAPSRCFEVQLSSGPLDEWYPLLNAQNRQVNRQLLRYLFWQCKLQKHLDLQHRFHLLGSEDFTDRLTTALFSSETQSAERKRGTVPSSEAVGLRLGAADGKTWPPASSELRLTLLSILSDVYRGREQGEGGIFGPQVELPGSLSFSIRELSDPEIERVLDPTSIYALDFLRLQYTAPAPLDIILTAAILEKYDEVFKFLLRLTRLYDATKQYRKNSLKSKHSSELEFGIEAHHIISTLMSYVSSVGVKASWQEMASALQKVENSLDQEDSPVYSLRSIQEIHSRCVETIRSRLFLRRKQEKIRIALESLFSSILAVIYHGHETAAGQFQAAVSDLIRLLGHLVDQPPRRKITELAEDDLTESVRILLLGLNGNGYYD